MTAEGRGRHEVIQDGRWIVGTYVQDQYLADGEPAAPGTVDGNRIAHRDAPDAVPQGVDDAGALVPEGERSP
jgi:hypothetical protein